MAFELTTSASSTEDTNAARNLSLFVAAALFRKISLYYDSSCCMQKHSCTRRCGEEAVIKGFSPLPVPIDTVARLLKAAILLQAQLGAQSRSDLLEF
jgi:hypothetical protein